MARTITKYSVVYGNELNGVEVDVYENKDALIDALAHWEGKPRPLVFASESISFQIDNTPRITLGTVKQRKPRAKKQKAAKQPTNGNTIASKGAPVGSQEIAS